MCQVGVQKPPPLSGLGQRVQEFRLFQGASEGCVYSVAGKKVPLKG